MQLVTGCTNQCLPSRTSYVGDSKAQGFDFHSRVFVSKGFLKKVSYMAFMKEDLLR